MLKIKYFDDSSGKELKPTRLKPLMIADFEYESQVKISEEFHSCAIDDINYHVNRVLNGNPKPRIFTKLPYLYRDFKEDGMMRFPFFEFCDHSDINVRYGVGYGRALVARKYFPDIKIDHIKSSKEFGIGSVEVAEKAISLIRNNVYWKDKSVPETVIVMLDKHNWFYYLKEIGFASDEYLERRKNWRPQEFVESTINDELWKLQEQIIKENPNNCFDGVVRGVLNNLDGLQSDNIKYYTK